MKVLSIGPDKDLLREDSVSVERHRAYASTFEHLHAIVFARRAKHPRTILSLGDNLTVYSTGSRSTPGLFIDAYRIGKKLLHEKGDWVISAQDPFESGLVAYVLSKATGVPFLLQEHGDFFSPPYYWKREVSMNRLKFFVGEWLLHRATHVRVVSERIKRAVEALGVRSECITVLPVYIECELFKTADLNEGVDALRPKGGVLVATMARLVPQKNLPLLIEAFKDVLAEGMNARLIIVGDGQEKQKLLACAQEYMPRDITFLAWTDNPAGVLKSADVYVLSSDYEGWGRVCIEALVAGTPLVMTDVGCAGEIVHTGKNGLVVPVRDKRALVNALVSLIRDEQLRSALALNGTRTIEELPTNDVYCKRYAECLKACLQHTHV